MKVRLPKSLFRVVVVLGLAIVIGIALILTGAFTTSEPSASDDGGAAGIPVSTPGSGSTSGSTSTASPTPGVTNSPGSTNPGSTQPAATHTAEVLLATIAIKGRAPMTGYARVADFGPAWKDVDHNGCDTRNDVLARDLTHVVKSGGCKVLTGTLVSPYTAAIIHFVRGEGTSTIVQIDHMVPLGNAWQTGAQQLTATQRLHLANDPLNLVAVDGRSNEQKGDGDAATWLPHNKAYRCTYVEHQIKVKAKYGLWMTRAEHDAILRVLGKC